VSSKRRQQKRAETYGHDATPRREGGWDHHTTCTCGAGSIYIRRAHTLRTLPLPGRDRQA